MRLTISAVRRRSARTAAAIAIGAATAACRGAAESEPVSSGTSDTLARDLGLARAAVDARPARTARTRFASAIELGHAGRGVAVDAPPVVRAARRLTAPAPARARVRPAPAPVTVTAPEPPAPVVADAAADAEAPAPAVGSAPAAAAPVAATPDAPAPVTGSADGDLATAGGGDGRRAPGCIVDRGRDGSADRDPRDREPRERDPRDGRAGRGRAGGIFGAIGRSGGRRGGGGGPFGF